MDAAQIFQTIRFYRHAFSSVFMCASIVCFSLCIELAVSVDQYTRNCKQDIHTPTQTRKRVCKSELILNWDSIYDLELQTNNRNHDSILWTGSSLQITNRTASAAVYERIMFRKAMKNFEMPGTFVELEMYFEVI